MNNQQQNIRRYNIFSEIDWEKCRDDWIKFNQNLVFEYAYQECLGNCYPLKQYLAQSKQQIIDLQKELCIRQYETKLINVSIEQLRNKFIEKNPELMVHP